MPTATSRISGAGRSSARANAVTATTVTTSRTSPSAMSPIQPRAFSTRRRPRLDRRSTSARIAASSCRRSSRRTTASTTSMPPAALRPARSPASQVVDPPVRRPVAPRRAGRGRRRGACRRAARTTPACAVGALLERGEDAAAVVVDHHDGQVGARLVGADDEAVLSCRKVRSPISAKRPAGVRPAQRGPDRRGHRAVDAGQAAVGDDHPPVADPVARHHQVEVADRVRRADEQQPAGRQGARDRPGDLRAGSGRRAPASSASSRSPAAASAASHSSSQPGVPGVGHGCADQPGSPSSPGVRSRPGSVVPGAARSATTSTSVRASSRVTGRRQRGVAADHDPLDPAGEVLVAEQQPVGADRVGAGARAAGRLGEQRPAGPLGEHPRRRTGVVTGDHDRAQRPAVERRRAAAGGPAPARPGLAVGPAVAAASDQPSATSGVSGSSSWRLRCTGPAAPPSPRAAASGQARRPATARRHLLRLLVTRRAGSPGARRRSRGPRRRRCRTWSVVWLAPVPRSGAGRSAVTHHERQPGVRRPRAPRGAGSRPPCRSWSPPAPAAGEVRGQAEREEAGRPLVDPGVQA